MLAVKHRLHRLLAFGAALVFVIWLGGLTFVVLYVVLYCIAYGVAPDMTLVSYLPSHVHGRLLVLDAWPASRALGLWLLGQNVILIAAAAPLLGLAASLAGLRLTRPEAPAATRPAPVKKPFGGGPALPRTGADFPRGLNGRFARRH